MTAIHSIVKIQDLFARWQALGYLRLANGTEMYCCLPDDEHDYWMHAVFKGLNAEQVETIEHNLGVELPPSLRSFYRGCGGMSLFAGGFTVAGFARFGFSTGDWALQPMSLIDLNHSVDLFGWRPKHAIAFATNGWDGSVHLVGMGETPNEVVRCDRRSGRITERHADVFACVEARLYRLDELAM